MSKVGPHRGKRGQSNTMIIHCPKCGYSRRPSDESPAGQCPSCGIVFETFLSSPKPPVEAPVNVGAAQKVGEARDRQALTACTACGGTVSYAAKACPHCGQPSPVPKQAPRPPTQVTKKHFAIAAMVLVLFFISLANQRDPMSAQEAARYCAKEAGLDPDSGQSVSMQHLRAIDACLNRLGFKTKP
jgi:predicted RNA-binding Zn-ribbon protein involved in translation (DUF1610 family)